jgi:phosphoribosyl 1,2-cyclic phosphate phosphodiesterase
MRLTFLGTGTSMGVPVIGCRCEVCRSSDPHNRRLRTSALLEAAGLNILIDAGPDLRQQLLNIGLTHLDAVLLTHAHADHVAGIDDLRPLNFAQHASIPVYGSTATLAAVRERFAYAFAAPDGSTRPALDLIPITRSVPFTIGTLNILPLDVQHGTWTITGYRIGRLGYVTDASSVPLESREQLRELDLLVLNALRHAPHPTHFTVAEAVQLAQELRPLRTLLVHMDHHLEHAATNAELPADTKLAYDGQTVDVAE